MNWVRQYKLYELGINIDESHKEVFAYLNEKFKNLTIYEVKKYKHNIFFMTVDGVCLMDYEKYDKRGGFLWISFEHVWGHLKTFEFLRYKSIMELLSYKFTKVFQMEVKEVVSGISYYNEKVEEMYPKRSSNLKCLNIYK